jgi:hypothetical protein
MRCGSPVVFVEDELSEGTIEMLVEEGFGHIVSVPNHERIAVLLSERARLIAELDSRKVIRKLKLRKTFFWIKFLK